MSSEEEINQGHIPNGFTKKLENAIQEMCLPEVAA